MKKKLRELKRKKLINNLFKGIGKYTIIHLFKRKRKGDKLIIRSKFMPTYTIDYLDIYWSRHKYKKKQKEGLINHEI